MGLRISEVKAKQLGISLDAPSSIRPPLVPRKKNDIIMRADQEVGASRSARLDTTPSSEDDAMPANDPNCAQTFLPFHGDPKVGGDVMSRLKKTWATVLSGTIVCADCKTSAPRTAPSQRYCPTCSDRRAILRKAKWAKEHPLSPEEARAHAKKTGRAKRSRLRDVGAAKSEANRRLLDEVFCDESGMAWVRRLCVPFSYAMSKNHMASMAPEGHVFLRKNSKKARVGVTAAVFAATRGVNVVQGKLWVDLIIQKPNHRGDAINVLDLVMDGIKDALPVDDRWYAIRRVDWSIVKDNPEILIGIGQEVTVDHRVCSYCGYVLPLDLFQKNRGSAGGHSRCCKDCQRVSRRRELKSTVIELTDL